jgi:interferon-induced GTP-binding protein Mx1
MPFHSSKQERYPIESREDVATVISKLTDSLCKESDFSDSTIVITIEAPDVPDLTLIDLPGIVRTTTSGQSKDVISMVDNLINKYLQQERTIVLAVIPADIDIAVVDILERAQQADPTGDRTIGVLTKVYE